jgi:hypothetical protein
MREEQRAEEEVEIEASPDRGEEAPLDIALDMTEPPEEPALVVEIDDEEEEQAPAPAAEAPGLPPDDSLVVELDDDEAPMPGGPAVDLDLSGVDFDSEPEPFPAKGAPWDARAGGELPDKAEPAAKSTGPATAAFSLSGVMLMAVAGLAGGLLGWAVTEPLQAALGSSDPSGKVMEVALYAALVGGAIGLALGAANGFAVGVLRKAVCWAGYGLLWGAIGGAAGGGLAQQIYGWLSVDYAFGTWAQLLLRATGWSIMGVFFGLAQAAVVTADRKMRNGILGGALGGLLGGLAFQLVLNASGSGAGGRCLALCALGLCIGALIGLVEEAAKEAWVRVTAGPLAGKQFILYEERTVIGSSPSCSITLYKDPQVAAAHAVIHNERTEFVIAGLLPGAAVLVNGRPAMRRVLEDGDSIGIGKTRMEFRERKKDEERRAGKVKQGKVLS